MYHSTVITMSANNKHIDQSSEISTLICEVSDFKAMVSVIQEIIMNQNKQISDIHYPKFNNPIKSKDVIKEEKKKALKSQFMMRNINK